MVFDDRYYLTVHIKEEATYSMEKVDVYLVVLGPQQDRGTWLYREAGFKEWSGEWGNYLTKELGLPGRDSQNREKREVPGPD